MTNEYSVREIKQYNSDFFNKVQLIVKEITDIEKYTIGLVMLCTHFEKISKYIMRVFVDNLGDKYCHIQKIFNLTITNDKKKSQEMQYDTQIEIFKQLLIHYNKENICIDISMKDYKNKRNNILHDGEFDTTSREQYEELYEKLHNVLIKLLTICSEIEQNDDENEKIYYMTQK
nr:hypothetical protein [uncultured Campylobacter sp.]